MSRNFLMAWKNCEIIKMGDKKIHVIARIFDQK